MRGIWVPAGLSGLVIAKKLEQRFGLLGFARMVKLVELVAELSAPDASPSAVVAWGDFILALGRAFLREPSNFALGSSNSVSSAGHLGCFATLSVFRTRNDKRTLER